MTKTLTEQWRDGELELGLYYVKTKKDAPLFCGEITEMSLEEEITISQDEKVEEVLAPVPSYDKVKEMSQKIERLEFDNEALELAHNEGKEINAELVSKTEQLEKKLAIATKALEQYANSPVGSKYHLTGILACIALKEIEGVK